MQKKTFRIITALIIGLVFGIYSGLYLDWRLAPLIGWIVSASLICLMFWRNLGKYTGKKLGDVAREEEISPSFAETLLIVASVMSIVAVAFLFASKSGRISQDIIVGVGLLGIVTSWATVHMLYAVRYAALYYHGDEAGGIDFNQKEPPRFIEFLYFSYTIGMTYQVSDTTITDSSIRKAALHHALLSFLFGTAVIASAINFAVSLTAK